MKPPMIPHAGRAIDTVNFRNVKESDSSMDMGNHTANGASAANSRSPSVVNGVHAETTVTSAVGGGPGKSGGVGKSPGIGKGAGSAGTGGNGGAGEKIKTTTNELVLPNEVLKGVPLDSGQKTPLGEEITVDPFEEFNSVTLHHDGDVDSDADARAR